MELVLYFVFSLTIKGHYHQTQNTAESMRKGHWMAKILKFHCYEKNLEVTPLKKEIEELFFGIEPPPNRDGKNPIEITTPVLSIPSTLPTPLISCKTMVSGIEIDNISSEVMVRLGDTLVGPVQKHFLVPESVREIAGANRPDWGAQNNIQFDVSINLRLLYCGEGFTLACMHPQRYGVDDGDQIWGLEGVYQRGGGEPFRVKLEFDNQGALVRKTGFYAAITGGDISPFELLIEDGDTFEPFVCLIKMNGEESFGTVNPIMLGGGFIPHWVQVEAPDEIFSVGIVASNKSGCKFRAYSELPKIEE